MQDLIERPADRSLALVVALALALFLPSLFSRGPWSPNEPHYLEIAREMQVSGGWLLPRLNGEIYPEKPPLFFWLVLVASYWTGEYLIAGRLVSTAATLLTVTATIWLGWRLFASALQIGSIAGVILVTSLLIFSLGQQAILDTSLAALTVVTIALLLVASQSDVRAGRAMVTLAALTLSAATLTKGLVAIFTVVAACATSSIARDGWRRFRPGPLIACTATATAALLLWLYFAASHAGDQQAWYWKQVLWTQPFGRGLSSWGHRQPIHYYLLQIPWSMAPWSLFLPAVCLAAWRRRTVGGRARLALLAWVVCLFVLFSIASAKRPLYILAIYPPLALLVAGNLHELSRSRQTSWLDLAPVYISGVLLVFGAALVIALPWMWNPLLAQLAPHLNVDEAETVTTLISALPAAATLLAPVLGLLLAILGVGLIAAVRRRLWRQVPMWLASGVAVASLGAHVLILPALDPLKSFRGFAEAVQSSVPAGEQIILWQKHYHGQLGYYTGALAYPVMQQDSLTQRIRAVDGSRLWIVADRDNDLPREIAPHFRLHLSKRVGHREMLLYSTSEK